MDMHSGGRTKIEPFNKILIEAPEDAAREYFTKRWGRDPEHVTCRCCGEDYSVSQEESLAQITGYDRHLRCTETKRDPVTGLYLNDDPKAAVYLEEGEDPPEGYGICPVSEISRRYYRPLTLDEYMAKPDVLVVRGEEVLALLHLAPDALGPPGNPVTELFEGVRATHKRSVEPQGGK